MAQSNHLDVQEEPSPREKNSNNQDIELRDAKAVQYIPRKSEDDVIVNMDEKEEKKDKKGKKEKKSEHDSGSESKDSKASDSENDSDDNKKKKKKKKKKFKKAKSRFKKVVDQLVGILDGFGESVDGPVSFIYSYHSHTTCRV